MKRRIEHCLKWLGAVCALVVAAGIAAPFLRADRYAEQIRTGLETALGRRVEFGDVRFKLFTGLGFSISKVVIHEDPAFGLEPFAYVGSLDARLALGALIMGRVEFASLSLDDARLNLTRVESDAGAAWNFAKILHRTRFEALPALYVRSGRVNFKFGDTKSVFYVTDTDLDVTPPGALSGGWRVRFSGQPARTDRPARGFGSLTADGTWRPAGQLDLRVQLEPSAMNEMISLFYGRDIGVHGLVSARARLAGPLSELHINGALNVEDVHRWDLLPQRGTGWPFEFEGRLNLPAERLEVDTHSAAKEAPPLAVRFRVADYLSQPHWGVSLNWNRFGVEPLLQLARHLGARLPDGFKIEGSLDGAIGYSGQGNWKGQLAFQDAAITIPDSAPIRFEQAKLLFEGGHVHLPEALARTPADDLARIEAEYDPGTGALDLSIATDSMAVAALRSQAALAAVPMLEQVESGSWKGKLRYQREAGAAGEWSGTFQLEDAVMPLPGIAEPVRVQSANAAIQGARVALEKIHATVGDLSATADYFYEPDAAHPHRVRIALASLDAAELERLLMPTLKRDRGLLARAFGFGPAPAPDWLRNRRADGTLAVDTLHVAGVDLENVRARLIWNGTTVVLDQLAGNMEAGTISGRLTADLRGARPNYHLFSRLKSVTWNGGTFDAEGALDTSGTGAALAANLRSQGSFTGQSFEDEPLDQFDAVSGCYAFAWAKSGPQLRFTDLQMSTGGEIYLGHGALQNDGRLLIQVSNGTRQLSVTGTLARLQLDESAGQ